MKHFYLPSKLYRMALGMVMLTCAGISFATDTPADPVTKISAVETSASECKNRVPDTALQAASTTDAPDLAPAWKISYTEGILTVTWINLYANCCPTEFITWIEKNEEERVLDLFASEDPDSDLPVCDCLCPYDVTGVFTDIDPGLWTFRFHTPGVNDFETLVYLNWLEEFILTAPDPEETTDNVEATEVKNLGCTRSQSDEVEERDPRIGYGYAWDMKFSGNNLEMTWKKIVTNCSTYGFNSWMKDNKDGSLDFYIDRINVPGFPMATCVCPYNVDTTFSDIMPGEYLVRLHVFDFYTIELTLNFEEGFETDFRGSDIVGVEALTFETPALRFSADNILSCTSTLPFTLEIISYDGLAPMRLNAEGSTEISLSNLPSGIYIARLTSIDGKVNTLRFSR